MLTFHLTVILSAVVFLSNQPNQGSCFDSLSHLESSFTTTINQLCVEYASASCHKQHGEMSRNLFYACCQDKYHECSLDGMSSRNGLGGAHCPISLVPVTFCYHEKDCQEVYLEVEACSK
eukprot:TCONS_00009527-protein